MADVVVGTQAIRRLPMLVEQAAAPHPDRHAIIDLDPYDDVTFPLGVTRRTDPVKAYVTIIEGCNEFCSFCVVPYTRGHERMRPKADILAEVREAAASGHREVQLLGQIVNHYEAPDDPACDFTGLLEAVHDVAGHRAHPVRQPASRGISTIASWTRWRACRRSAGICTCRCSRDRRACSRRCGAATRARAISISSTAIRDALPDVALSTDMIVGSRARPTPTSTETLSLTAAVRYHSMFSFKYSPRPNTLAEQRYADDVPEEEKTRRIVALQALQREIQTAAERGDWSGTEVEVLVDAASRRRDTELSGRTQQNVVVNLPGPADWIGQTRAGPRRARRAAQRVGAI